ncbi:hypothetical protein VAR608DRAFT_0669 [Variovorax sp. HW608]|uniref:hypothetical protein n=1 Tax=Variovorax sp. HW608 TaxID=1034889 RepID=UPI00081FE7BE|nr:hypothetical protein [Variovorax sp. HW608]SCK12167.1 hypothetical protein VAR608DRAFT_0669 [Variovorax sp. HW608]
MRFLRARGTSLAVVVLVMFLVTALQAGISYSVGEGPLSKLEPSAFGVLVPAFFALRFGLLLFLALLWLLGRKRALFRTIIVANAYFTLALLLDVISLLQVLGGLRQAAASLLIDAALMSVSNMFIFSIWYWIVDPPGVEEDPQQDEPWAFLFPQRGSTLPHYASWSPQYADYLFIGFTTNFAFSPTDALPLTRTAKMLMLLQSAISVVIVTGIAGGAINALVGSA